MELKDIILDCGEEHSFKLADGRAIRSLSQFNEALSDMDENVFRHHVNNEKNDFSAWIKEVINDEKLADSLLKTKDKNETHILVLKRILELVNEMT